MKKFILPAILGIVLLVTGVLLFVSSGMTFSDANTVQDRASDELHLNGRSPHSVWKDHAGDLGLWVGFAILAFGMSSGWYCFYRKRLKRLEAIVRAMPARAAVVDGSGKIRLFHNDPDDGNPPPARFDDLPEDIRDALRETVRQVLKTGETRRVEYCCMGRRRRAELVRLGKEIFGTATVLWTSTDIDDLHRLSERFRRMLKSISDGVIVVDDDENITLVNRTATRLFGHTCDEMIGRKLWDFAGLIDKNGKDMRFAPVRRAMESGSPVELTEGYL